MIQFQTVQVGVTGTGVYQGMATFDGPIHSADIALRGLNLPTYTNGSAYHYRGPTTVDITSVNVHRAGEVQFTFTFNFSENPDYQMTGTIDFLAIADTAA